MPLDMGFGTHESEPVLAVNDGASTHPDEHPLDMGFVLDPHCKSFIHT